MEERFYTVCQLAEAAFNKNSITSTKILAEEYHVMLNDKLNRLNFKH